MPTSLSARSACTRSGEKTCRRSRRPSWVRRYEREWPNLTFLYHDGLLARLRKEIPDREERLLAYRSLSVDGIINFTRLHDFEKRRLMAMDKQFGCEIGQFILDNFQRRRLFYT